MSLKKCQECGHEVSSSAIQCPNCGAYVNNSKTILWVVVIVALIISVAVIYYAWYNSDEQVIRRASESFRRGLNNELPKFELESIKLNIFKHINRKIAL